MIKQLASGLIITALSCNLALADGKYGHRGSIDHARVIKVEPITETLSHSIPRESCWTERIGYREQRSDSYTPAIIGGILGAAVGNSLGHTRHKTNRAIKAVALGALGASIGNQIGKSNRHDSPVSYRDERRCDVSYDTRYEQRIVGYDVTYRYQGKTYRTEMDYDPGSKIRVRVDVRPVM